MSTHSLWPRRVDRMMDLHSLRARTDYGLTASTAWWIFIAYEHAQTMASPRRPHDGFT